VNSSRILVSGVSGPIGAALLPSLKASGYGITRLVRGKPSGESQIAWDPQQPLAPESVSGFEAVIHLAGESVVGRWTEAKKRRILESRASGTRHLAEALAKSSKKTRTFITASASGYYGDRNDELLRETSSPGTDFLSEVCRQWESATKRPLRQAFGRSIYESESCSRQLEAPCKKCWSLSAWEWAETWALARSGGAGFTFRI